MESSSGERLEAIVKNPLMRAGIPLILSAAAAFISAKILSKRSSLVSESEEEDDDEDEERNSQELESPRNDVVGVVEDLKRREYELEMRFLVYKDMKERETAIMEIENKLGLEMVRLEFLGREAALMAAEARRMGTMMGAFLGVVRKLEASMWEKGLAEKKAKRLRRKVKEMSKAMREQSLCLKTKDDEIISNREEAERKSEVIVVMEKEIEMIKGEVYQLKEEKIELLNKLEMVEISHHKKEEEEGEVVTKEAYDKVVEELELTEKDRAAKESELINLRWSNACLKHELKRYEEQHQPSTHDDDSRSFRSELESEISVVDAAGSLNCQDVDWDVSSSAHNEEGTSSRRKRMMKKLRKWVDGGKMQDEKQKHEEMVKCFGKNLLEDHVNHHAPRRNSFSSV